ncbi:hypothetical protein [Gimesia panareensis]|nr:hypothetical protein [Gimesia panareensis]
MNHIFITLLMISLLLFTGCSKEGNVGNEAVGEAKASGAESPSPEGARAHVQKYVDRLMGGDESVKNGLLSIAGVDFGSFNSIEITSSNQMYSKSGVKVDRMFSVRMRVTGVDSRNGKPITKNIERGVMHNDKGYRIIGAEF